MLVPTISRPLRVHSRIIPVRAQPFRYHLRRQFSEQEGAEKDSLPIVVIIRVHAEIG